MDSSPPKNYIVFDFSPFYIIREDGKVHRLMGTETVPPSPDGDPKTSVQSKDVIISSETGVGARIYRPKGDVHSQKVPILIYFHGGAFLVQSAFSPTYMEFLNSLAKEANIIIVSVDYSFKENFPVKEADDSYLIVFPNYRIAPEHPLPIAYEDCWTALKWVVSHSFGEESEPWLTDIGDFSRLFLAGDSAGANIAHRLGVRLGLEGLQNTCISGLIMMHPYFWGKDPIGSEKDVTEIKVLVDKFWVSACPTSTGSDDPWINPVLDPDFSRLACSRVLVFVSQKDVLRHRGWLYCEALKKSGWNGEVEILEIEGEVHVFHLEKPDCDKAKDMVKKVACFINNH